MKRMKFRDLETCVLSFGVIACLGLWDWHTRDSSIGGFIGLCGLGGIGFTAGLFLSDRRRGLLEEDERDGE